MAIEQNKELDANLIFLCMKGMQLIAGMRYNLKPDELQARADWLRTQPEEYITSVVELVEQLEDRSKRIYKGVRKEGE